MNQLSLISVALGLVALNGFFVAAEFGLVKLRHTRVQTLSETGGLLATTLLKVHGHLDAYLSACQLGITLASIGLGWVGEPAFAHLLTPLMHMLNINDPALIEGVSFAFAFIVISYLHIVVGELAPKSVAIRLPERTSLFCAFPLFCFYWLMYPGIWLLNKSANMLLRWVGLKNTTSHDAHYSSDEIKLILSSADAPAHFKEEEWDSLTHMIDFAELNVADVMRPFNEVVFLDMQATPEEKFHTISTHRFSRYPCLDKKRHVLGMVYLKDLYLNHASLENSAIEKLIHPGFFVTPETSALSLLRKFRAGASHFAIVGRKERALGFVVLDDLLSLLIGEMKDEFLQHSHSWKKEPDGSLIGKGSLSIVSLERALGFEIEHSDEVDSIGGLIMLQHQDIPKENDMIRFEGFSVVIKKMKGPRIIQLKVTPFQTESK